MSKAHTITITIALTALAAIIAITPNTAPANTTPDWTVAPCSWWADTSHPVLPPYTRTDVCALPDGTLSVAS